MLRQRQGQDVTDAELSAEAEERIRQDERRRVLAEVADERAAVDPRRAARADDRGTDESDWRDAQPPFADDRVEDSRSASTTDDRTTTADPRRWAVPDDRWEPGDERVETDRVERTDEGPGTAPHVVQEETVVAQEDTVVERGFSPGQILLALAGAAFLVLGILAVNETGLDSPLSQPVEPVLDWNHTALLGIFEIGAGALMLLSALRAGARWLGGLVGIAAIVAGVLILSELDWTINELGAERDFGWVPIVIGAVAVIGAAIPRIRRTRRVTTKQSMLT